MTTTMVLPAEPTVKLQGGEVYAGVRRDTLRIQQGYAQYPLSLDLDEAIKLAQFVLRYASENGISVPEASADIALLPPDYDESDGYRLRF